MMRSLIRSASRRLIAAPLFLILLLVLAPRIARAQLSAIAPDRTTIEIVDPVDTADVDLDDLGAPDPSTDLDLALPAPVLTPSAMPSIISAVLPLPGSYGIAAGTTIGVTFTPDVDPSSLTLANATVWGSVSGAHGFSHNYVAPTWTITPTTAFTPGELVTVTLSSNILTLSPPPFTGGYTWQFRVGTQASSGTFVYRQDVAADAGVLAVAVTDLDGNGTNDLVAVNRTALTLLTYSNDGTGAFTPQTTYPTSLNPVAVAAANVTGDLLPDLIVANRDAHTIDIFTNTGAFTFGIPITLALPSNYSPRDLAVGDVNGDGLLDIVVASISPNKLSVFLNSGGGGFAPQVDYTTGARPRKVVLADFDGDGHLDVAVAHRSSNTFSVRLNDGTGSFGAPTSYTAGSSVTGVAAGDLNGDKIDDLVAISYDTKTLFVYQNKADHSGELLPATPSSYPVGSRPVDVAIADVDGDGDGDIIVANRSSSDITVLKNDGHAAFSNSATYAIGSAAWITAAADLDGDGILDLAVSRGGRKVRILSGASYLLSVDPTSGSVAVSPNQASYPSGTLVQLSATAPSGRFFVGWTGDASGNVNPLTIVMSSNKSVTARFSAGSGSGDVLWGVTNTGGATGDGTLFYVDPANPVITKAADFSPANGTHPSGSLLRTSDDHLWGVTSAGGDNGVGVLFEYAPQSGEYTVRAHFSSAVGSNPTGTLVLGSDGNFYGLAFAGGANDLGTIYRYVPGSGLEKMADMNVTDGYHAEGALFRASDGNYYGLASEGGTSNYGTLFRYAEGSFTYTKMADFRGDGFLPYGSLIEPEAGILYGTTYGGNGVGMIFSWQIGGGSPVTKRTNLSFSTGRSAFGTLIKGDNGHLYGLVSRGASSDLGAVIDFDPGTDSYVNRVDLSPALGSHPYGSLMRASDGNYYGLTHTGGASNLGGVFRYAPPAQYQLLVSFDGTNGASPVFTHLVEGPPPGSLGRLTDNFSLFPAALPAQPNGISFFNPDTGLAVGDGAMLYRTTNGGASWSALPTGPLSGNLLSVRAHGGAATAVVCGDSGLIGRTTDYGSSWSVVPSGTASALRSLTDDADNYDESLVTAVGDAGTILRSTDDGASWSMQTSGTTDDLQSVTFWNADTGVVTGATGIYRTTDGGTTWLSVGPPSAAARTASMAAISTTRSNIKTAPGCVITVSGGGAIVRSADYGATWLAAASGVTEDLNGLVVSGGLYVAVGNNGTVIASSTGADWTPVNSRTNLSCARIAVKEKGVQLTDIVIGTSTGAVLLSAPDSSHYLGAISGPLCSGTIVPLTWTSIQPPSTPVTLELYRPSTKSVVATIASGIPNSGSYSWTIDTAIADGTYQIRISSLLPLDWNYSSDVLLSHCAPAGAAMVRGIVTEENAAGSSAGIQRGFPAPMKKGEPIRDVSVSLGKKPPYAVFHTVTDSLGRFEFPAVGPGSYVLTIATPPGASIAFPVESSYEFVVQGTDTVEGLDFRVALSTPDATWHTVPLGTTSTVNAVALCNGTDAVAVGDSGTILHSTNGGSTWEAATLPGGTPPQVKGVALWCVNGAAGTGVAVGDGGIILRSTDGGTSWSAVTSPTVQTLTAVATLDDSIAVAVGANGTIIRSIDRAASWSAAAIIDSSSSPRSISGMPGGTLNAVRRYRPDQAVAVGNGGLVYRSVDHGATWFPVASGTPADLFAVEYFDALHVIASGDNVIIRSSDGGANWSVDSTNQGVVRSIAGAGPWSAYAVSGGGVLTTTDRGVTWAGQATPSAAGARATSSATSFTMGGVAVGNYDDHYARVVLLYGEGGEMQRMLERASESAIIALRQGWNLVSLPVEPFTSAKDELFRFASSGAFSFDAGYRQQSSLESGTGYWVKYDDASSVGFLGTAVTEDSVAVHAGWNILGSISAEIDASSITSVPPGLITSSFFSYGPGGYATTDLIRPGEAYWVKLSGPGTLILSSVSIDPTNRIRIVPSEDLPPSPPDARPATEVVPETFALSQNYPNPFNPTTTIAFDLPSAARVSLRIYDIVGREVATLADNVPYAAGRQTLSFDAGMLSSGAYFYRLRAEGGSTAFNATRTMFLLR